MPRTKVAKNKKPIIKRLQKQNHKNNLKKCMYMLKNLNQEKEELVNQKSNQ